MGLRIFDVNSKDEIERFFRLYDGDLVGVY